VSESGPSTRGPPGSTVPQTQYRFYRLRDELTFYLASRPPEQIEAGKVAEMFREYQAIWDQLGSRWLEYRQGADRSG
jgi:hypothetical protein